MAPSFPVLEFNCFLFFNKQFSENVVSAWGPGLHDVKAGADKMSLDQIWVSKPDPHYLGYFYLENVIYEGCRLCQIGSEERDIGLVSGEMVANYGEEQLWKFVPKGNGYFQIVNKRYNTLLSIWDNGATFGVRPDKGGDDQQWKVEQRYDCKIEEQEIYEIDNRSGTEIIHDRFELTIGVKMLYPDYLKKTSYMSKAMENAMVAKMLDGTITLATFGELKMEQWRSESRDLYDEWYDVLMVPGRAYPGKKYKITQMVAVCTGRLETDKAEVRGPWKAYVET